MDVSAERIRDRLVFIREQVGVLEPLAHSQELRQSRLQDPLSYGGIVRSLQTSIEAMIDIAFHLCAKLHAREPQSAANAFEILVEFGDLPRAFLPKALKMVRFRNLVVHGYLHVDSGAVEAIVTEDLGDFAEWETIVGGLAR